MGKERVIESEIRSDGVHKSALSKYKKIEIILCIFSDHSAMKLEINHKKKFGKVSSLI